MPKSTLIFQGHIMPKEFAPDRGTELPMNQNESVMWQFFIQHEKFKVVRKGEFASFESALADAVIFTAAIFRAQVLESDQPLDVEFTDWVETDRDTPSNLILGEIKNNLVAPQAVDIKLIEGCVDNARYIATLPALRWAVEDYNTALKLRNEAPFYCFRAVESLRSYFDASDDRKYGWEQLRDKLHIDQKFLDYLTDQSKAIRHGAQKGQIVQVEPEISSECIKRCKTVITNFLEFVKTG